jgi:hypothetical protein
MRRNKHHHRFCHGCLAFSFGFSGHPLHRDRSTHEKVCSVPLLSAEGTFYLEWMNKEKVLMVI